MNGLDLFSGIGGMSCALRQYVKTIAYCENDRYCQSVLLSRMRTGDIDIAPIWDDIRSFPADELGQVDIVFGGFPCQDISIERIGAGLAGERSGLFWEAHRIIKEKKPTFIFLENVPAIRSRGGVEVVESLIKLGYECRWCIISAASIGARHIRERWFLLAYSKSERLQTRGFALRESERQSRYKSTIKYALWDQEPENKFEMAGMADGFSSRVDATRALGNAVVPEQAKKAFEILIGIK